MRTKKYTNTKTKYQIRLTKRYNSTSTGNLERMATSISFLRWRIQTELLKVHKLAGSGVVKCKLFSTAEDVSHVNTEADVEEAWAEAEEEAKWQQLQNVSGLPPNLFQHLHGEVVEPPFRDLKRRRNLYVKYGSKSGEDPRLLWPSKQELAKERMENLEDEVPLLEKLRLMNQEKEEALQVNSQRQKMIEKNMSQMNKWIAEYHKRIGDAEAEVQKRQEKKEALLDEARDYFGYRIKANDPKFQMMVEEKEEREKKEARERKKNEKARKLNERLKQDMLAMKTSGSGGSAADEK